MTDFLRNILFRRPSHALAYLLLGAMGIGLMGLALINWRPPWAITSLGLGMQFFLLALAEWVPANQVRLAGILRILSITAFLLNLVVLALMPR